MTRHSMRFTKRRFDQTYGADRKIATSGSFSKPLAPALLAREQLIEDLRQHIRSGVNSRFKTAFARELVYKGETSTLFLFSSFESDLRLLASKKLTRPGELGKICDGLTELLGVFQIYYEKPDFQKRLKSEVKVFADLYRRLSKDILGAINGKITDRKKRKGDSTNDLENFRAKFEELLYNIELTCNLYGFNNIPKPKPAVREHAAAPQGEWGELMHPTDLGPVIPQSVAKLPSKPNESLPVDSGTAHVPSEVYTMGLDTQVPPAQQEKKADVPSSPQPETNPPEQAFFPRMLSAIRSWAAFRKGKFD